VDRIRRHKPYLVPQGMGCAVALGDPPCPLPSDRDGEFRAFCQQNNWDTVYALTTASSMPPRGPGGRHEL
jgi:hypothetical protein